MTAPCASTVDDLRDGTVGRTYREPSRGRLLHEEDRCAVCHGALVYHRRAEPPYLTSSSDDDDRPSVSMWCVVAADVIMDVVAPSVYFVIRTSRLAVRLVGRTSRVSFAMAIASVSFVTRIVF